MANLNNVTVCDVDTLCTIQDMFEYHPWGDAQKVAGKVVQDALEKAVQTIVVNVPPCPDRTTAIQKLREARMDCNSAITHNGKY